MNLKEYNYCKRHHPQALARFLGIKINKIETIGYDFDERGAGCWWELDYPKPEATFDHKDVSRWLTIYYLI